MAGSSLLTLLDDIATVLDDVGVAAADAALGQANITVNKNSVPNDPQSPFVTSGIRVGTPAITTRGFKEPETRKLTGWICDVLDRHDDAAVIQDVKGRVLELCGHFPVYSKDPG